MTKSAYYFNLTRQIQQRILLTFTLRVSYIVWSPFDYLLRQWYSIYFLVFKVFLEGSRYLGLSHDIISITDRWLGRWDHLPFRGYVKSMHD